MFIFSTPELIRNLWQLKTAVFMHWCLLRAVPFMSSHKLAPLTFNPLITSPTGKNTIIPHYQSFLLFSGQNAVRFYV
jgi:hypothetical protein